MHDEKQENPGMIQKLLQIRDREKKTRAALPEAPLRTPLFYIQLSVHKIKHLRNTPSRIGEPLLAIAPGQHPRVKYLPVDEPR